MVLVAVPVVKVVVIAVAVTVVVIWVAVVPPHSAKRFTELQEAKASETLYSCG